jgi:hypothetical protein
MVFCNFCSIFPDRLLLWHPALCFAKDGSDSSRQKTTAEKEKAREKRYFRALFF